MLTPKWSPKVSEELYDSNILTSGKGAHGDDPGPLAKGTNPHPAMLGVDIHHGDSEGHHGLVAHHFIDLDQQREAGTLGMWLFLATEVMFIGSIFVAYFTYRLQPQYFWAFRQSSENLIMWVGFVNTLVLLTSSLTVVLAIRACQLGQKKWVFWHLILTFILGSMFFGFKVYEYSTDYNEHLWPGLEANYPDWTPDREKAGLTYFLPEKGFVQKYFPKDSKLTFEEMKEQLAPVQIDRLHVDLDHAKLFYRFYYSLPGFTHSTCSWD
jgi:heme/copper-type cytochrome/quinol oxidase subunit 3